MQMSNGLTNLRFCRKYTVLLDEVAHDDFACLLLSSNSVYIHRDDINGCTSRNLSYDIDQYMLDTWTELFIVYTDEVNIVSSERKYLGNLPHEYNSKT